MLLNKNGISLNVNLTIDAEDIEQVNSFISMMLDIILQPLLLTTKSYIKDTPDFLRKLSKEIILEEEHFFTLNVSSLYTNIPLEESLRIMEKDFFPYTNCIIPQEYLVRMLELILKCNNFTFNRKHFLQVNGTAMDARVAHIWQFVHGSL